MSNKTEKTLKKGICLNCGEPLSHEESQGYCSRECVNFAFEKDVEETEITWTGSDDDLTAVVGNYKLEVIKMLSRSKQEWWHWSVWKQGYWVASNTQYIPKEAAQRAAEEAYFKHLKSK